MPRTIHHQGRVAVNGVNFDGAGSFRFLLFTDLDANQSSGNEIAVWKNDDGTPANLNMPASPVPVLVKKGLYSVQLGGVGQSALPASLVPPSGRRLFLRIWFDNGVNGVQQLGPDQELASVPFALHAAGVEGIGIGDGGLTWGFDAQAPAQYATAFGFMVDATATNATAWGNRTLASNGQATAWGMMTEASGLRSTAFGTSTESSGTSATAWGANTLASGEGSTAWGAFTQATGLGATAWGSNAIASGNTATAWGYFTTASGVASTSWGSRTSAPSFAETVLGQYNTNYTPAGPGTWQAADRLLVVGKGIADLSRADALVMLKNGDTTWNGNMTVNGTLTATTLSLPASVVQAGEGVSRLANDAGFASTGAANLFTGQNTFSQSVSSAGSYRFTAARTGRLQISPAQFRPGRLTSSTSYDAEGDVIFPDSSSTEYRYTAPVQLPKGATLTEVRFHLWDEEDGPSLQSFTGSIRSRQAGDQTVVILGSITDAGTIEPAQIIATFSDPVVDSARHYTLNFIFTASGSSLNLGFIGASVTYTTETLEP